MFNSINAQNYRLRFQARNLLESGTSLDQRIVNANEQVNTDLTNFEENTINDDPIVTNLENIFQGLNIDLNEPDHEKNEAELNNSDSNDIHNARTQNENNTQDTNNVHKTQTTNNNNNNITNNVENNNYGDRTTQTPSPVKGNAFRRLWNTESRCLDFEEIHLQQMVQSVHYHNQM